MKQRSSITTTLLAGVVLLSSLSAASAAVIFSEAFSGSTVMATNPAAPTATSTDYAILSTKPATNSTMLDLVIPGTSSGLAEAQALFTSSPVVLADGETLRLQITFEGTLLMDGGDSYIDSKTGLPTAGTQFIAFGLYNSGGSYPVPAGALATGDLGLKEAGDYGSGYAAGWQGYVGRIGNPSANTSAIYTRNPQTDTWNESQDTLFNDGVTGGFDTPPGTYLNNNLDELILEDGVYTMVLDISKGEDAGLTVAQSLYAGAGTSGTVLYSATGSDYTYRFDTFDAFAFGYRARGDLTATIHMNISDVEISTVDLQTPSVSGLGDVTLTTSQNLKLSPVITGASPLSIQWSSNSVVIAGATNDSLAVNFVQMAQDGTVFSVIASNEFGVATDSMTLTVLPTSLQSSGLYNIQLNYGTGSPTYSGAAQVGNTNDVWNNPVWEGVGTVTSNIFGEVYLMDSGGINLLGVTATMKAAYNDGIDWNKSGNFNHYSSRTTGSATAGLMDRVVKVDKNPDVNTLTIGLHNLPVETACTVYVYGSGQDQGQGGMWSLAPTNTVTNEISTAVIMYDTNSVYAATGRDVTLATSQGLGWEVLSGVTDPSGNLTIIATAPPTGVDWQIYMNGVQVEVDMPSSAPTVDPVIQSIAVSGTSVTLSWTAEDIGSYSILRKTSLDAAEWSTVVSNLPAGDLTTNVTASGASEEFYQIIGE